MQGIEKTTPPDKEHEATRLLVTDIVPRIDALRARWEGPNHTAERGSALAGDDTHTRPYHVSHAAWLSIGHAIDNLVALRTLTVQGEGNEITVATRAFAAYPPMRAALENASSAIWLIGPRPRDERLTRRFRLLLTNAANRDKALRLVNPHVEPAYDRLHAEVRRLTDGRGLSIEACQKSVTFREVVRGAHTIMGLEEATGEAIWRILSGLTHGDSWASHMVTDRDEVSVSTDDEVYTVRTTSSLTNIASMTSIALSVTTNAITLFDSRRTPST